MVNRRRRASVSAEVDTSKVTPSLNGDNNNGFSFYFFHRILYEIEVGVDTIPAGYDLVRYKVHPSNLENNIALMTFFLSQGRS